MEHLNYNKPTLLESFGLEPLPVDLHEKSFEGFNKTCAVIGAFIFAVEDNILHTKVYSDMQEITELLERGFTQSTHPIGLRAHLREFTWYKSLVEIGGYPDYFKNLYETTLEKIA